MMNDGYVRNAIRPPTIRVVLSLTARYIFLPKINPRKPRISAPVLLPKTLLREHPL